MVPKPTPAPVAAPAPVVPKQSPEEEAKQARLKRIDEMIRKGRLEALRPMWEKYASDFTPLHLSTAASSGQEEVLRFLLVEAKLDPTIAVEGKIPYDVSSTKGVRNTFRRVAYDNPTMFDWTAAHVPSGLSEEAEAAQNQKKADRRKGMREKLKERAATRQVEEEEVVVAPTPVAQLPPTNGGPQRLGGAAGVAGLGGMSSEMRAQIERERRARAAEARFKTTSA